MRTVFIGRLRPVSAATLLTLVCLASFQIAARVASGRAWRSRPAGVGSGHIMPLAQQSGPARGARQREAVTMPSSTKPPVRSRSKFEDFDVLAQLASAGGEAEVADFVAYSLKHSILWQVAHSVRLRLTNAELAYRQHRQKGLADDDLVRAFNSAVDRFHGPGFVRTTRAQIGLLKQVLVKRVPNLPLISRDDAGHDETVSSPVEVAFVLAFLATQKAQNGEYQMDADEWVKATHERFTLATRVRAGPATADGAKPLAADVWEMLAAPSAERGRLTVSVHTFLDDLGIRR